MEKLYFNKNIFTLYLNCSSISKMQISHVSCSTTMLQLKLIVNSPCYNIYLQLFVTLQKVQDVTTKTQNPFYFF